jgi:hypothetical protein
MKPQNSASPPSSSSQNASFRRTFSGALAPTALLMVRPFRTYAALAGGEDLSFWTGAGRLLFVFGAFVALTSTGRLAPAELLGAFASFAYAPVIQAVALGIALRVVSPRTRFARASALYLEGHGPYFLLFLGIAGACLFAPDPASVILGAALPLLLATLAWGGVLTYACFRSGLGLARRRAAGGMVIFYVSAVGFVLAYFFAAGQLAPILPFVWR